MLTRRLCVALIAVGNGVFFAAELGWYDTTAGLLFSRDQLRRHPSVHCGSGIPNMGVPDSSLWVVILIVF